MNKKIVVFLSILVSVVVFPAEKAAAQKLLVDSNAYGKWAQIGGTGISNDGKYVCYEVTDRVARQDTLFVMPNDMRWKDRFMNARSSFFTQDSRWLIFQRNDSVFRINLENRAVESLVAGILGSYEALKVKDDEDMLVYRLKTAPDQMIVLSLSRQAAPLTLANSDMRWYHSGTGNFLYIEKVSGNGTDSLALKYVNLKDKSESTVWKGSGIQSFLFSEAGNEVVFLAQDGAAGHSVWYCKLIEGKAIKLADDHTAGIDADLQIADILGINRAGTRVYFNLTEKNPAKVPSPSVDVWSYTDPKLQSMQLYELKRSGDKSYVAAVGVDGGQVRRLTYPNEVMIEQDHQAVPNNWMVIYQHQEGDEHSEWNWNKKAIGAVYLLSVSDGRKRLIYDSAHSYRNRAYLSPDEKYVVYYDPDKANYYSYEVATGNRVVITNGAHANWIDHDRPDEPFSKHYAAGIAGFTSDGRVLLYSEYDLYKADLSGREVAINLTKSIGERYHIRFVKPIMLEITKPTGELKDEFIIDAFNTETKQKGLYRINITGSGKLDSLTMQLAYVYYMTGARDVNAYLLFAGTASSHANCFLTTDFTKFEPVTNLHPENNYNWLTAELVNYKLPDGRTCQGILYKPENFDPAKKYPLIFHYYETMSDRLYENYTPALTNGNLEYEIPQYVSNGFMVFTPDIHYTIGEPGRSAYNSIMGAVKELSKRPYINTAKMGLQGASFGGFETNYIIAHTHLFAAAMADCSMTNFVSAYLSIIGDGTSRQKQYELYRDRMGGTLWEIPEKYIDNSPVFRADKITTPLLLCANNLDGDVPHQQGIELFTALRRLGKKAWMLQYDGEGHGIGGETAQKDYTMRMYQFFCYFLKDTPPPKWMTEGVPAEQKRYYSGMEVDESGARP